MNQKSKLREYPPGKFHQYDKIWRENLYAVMPGLIRKVLGIEAASSERLPDKLILTPQRETDFLSKITNHDGSTFILHIEIQVRNDPDMAHRMAVYKTLTEQIYKLPVRQYVLYLGEKAPTMPTTLVFPGLRFEYTLIRLSELPCELFLDSDTPEEKLLAILADFGSNDPSQVLQTLLEMLNITSDHRLTGNRYLRHLRVFAQLRNLEIQLEKAMESVSTFFREEKDVFFIRGERKGTDQAIYKTTCKMIRKGYSNKEITDVLEVSSEFINRIREKIAAEK